jgi:hypothetical protein
MNCKNELDEPLGERNGIIIGLVEVVGFTIVVLTVVYWIAPWKTVQALRRPLDLINLYGYLSGIALYLFGSRTTWCTEAYVLGKANDSDALNFKKSAG